MSADISTVRAIPLAALTFSTTPAQIERRAHLDKGKLRELADSIKSHGLVQPILVRPTSVYALPCGHAILDNQCNTSQPRPLPSLPIPPDSSMAKDPSGLLETDSRPASRKGSATAESSSAVGSKRNGGLGQSTASARSEKITGGRSGSGTSQPPERSPTFSALQCPICSSARTMPGKRSKSSSDTSLETDGSDGHRERLSSSDQIGGSLTQRSPARSADPARLSASVAKLSGYKLIDIDGRDASECWEVVAGERRAIAAKQAGLEEIQATVRELTDEQVLELQLIENLQRQDLHELAEAEGYEALQKLGHTIEDMADKVGKSKATIYARMKLLALTADGRKAFYEGRLSASTALLVARIPAALQKQALGEITKPQGWGEDKQLMSARAAQKHIHENYMLRLADAGFKTADAMLVPAAGACGPCPKRTGNQPQLFDDVKGADVCTDPICFKLKIKAHAERVIAAAVETGQKVLVDAEAKKVARHSTQHLEGYVRLDARDYERKGTFRQTLGKAYVPTLLQDPDTGKMIEVAPNKDVNKAHGEKESGSIGEDASSRRWKAEQRTRERKHRAEIAYRLALFKAVHEAGTGRKTLTRQELEAVSERLFERLDHDSKKRLFAALGWESRKRRGGYGLDLDLPTPVEKMSDEQLVQLIRDCSLAYELQVWQHSGESRPKALEAAAAALAVDAKKIRRALEASAKARESKKAAAPAKASKKKAAKK